MSIRSLAIAICLHAFAYAKAAVVDLCLTVASTFYLAITAIKPVIELWKIGVRFSVAAYRSIGLLKPEYDDSYETHGLSLLPPHRC